MVEVFKNRERAQDFYLVSVESDLAREGSKLNLNKRKKIRCPQAGRNTYVLAAESDVSKSGVAKQVLAGMGFDFTAWTLKPATRCQSWPGESESNGPVPPTHLGSAASWEQLEQGSCGGGTAVRVSLGNLLKLSHAPLEKALQILIRKGIASPSYRKTNREK